MQKCIHDITAITCSVCKDKPEYKPKPQEKPTMKEVKKCIIEGCTRNQHSRELCSMHWYQWRHGKIEHPIYGTWKPADPNHPKLKKRKNKTVKKIDDDETKPGIVDKIQPLTANLSILSLLRTKLKECLPIVQTLNMLGMKDKVRTEIADILCEWVGEKKD